MEITQFRKEDLSLIEEQEITIISDDYLSDDYLDRMEKSPFSYTIWDQGKILGSLGIFEHTPQSFEAWAILDKQCGGHFISIHRAVKRFLEAAPMSRIIAVVDYEFDAGHRWASLLGFDCEASRLTSYYPSGRDASLYAKVKYYD